MSGTPVRVAVEVGSTAVRLAGAAVDGEPWLIARLPCPAPPVADLLADLVGLVPDELLLVHPVNWSAPRVAGWAQECAGLAQRVRPVPAPLAAAGVGERAVLDVGHAGAEATRLAADGTVLASRACPTGGAHLDAVVLAMLGDRPLGAVTGPAEARRVREALSLLPEVSVRQAGALPGAGATAPSVRLAAGEVRTAMAGPLGAPVDALRAVLNRAGQAPVLLVGGVARTPLLAELVDAAGIGDAAVAPRPELAAVLGALVLPPQAAPAASGASGQDRHASVVAGADRSTPAAPVGGRRMPPPPPREHRVLRAAVATATAAATTAGLLAMGALLPGSPAPTAVPAGVLVQYGYRLDVPAGWEHTGGLPERRRSLLTPAGAPEGSDLIAVERSPLGYDAGAEPDRAQAELRAEFDAAVAGGSALSGFEPGVAVAGREVTTYEQRDGPTTVDWFVVLDGDAQLSVGCRHTDAGAAAVRAACAVVVASVRRD